VRVSVSSSTVLIGAAHFLNKSLLSSSNLARVSVSLKSIPSYKTSKHSHSGQHT
jgi:hypothetical protein